MNDREILKMIDTRRSESHHFVKWWRKEEDFLDYDLIERFIENVAGTDEIEGAELLTMDDMWSELKRIGGTRIKLLHDPGGNKIEWLHTDTTGTRAEVCEFTPEVLMTIFDVETKGNPVDS